MAVTPPPTVGALPAAPDPNDRTTFNIRAYPWAAAQATFNTQVVALAANVFGNATDAATSAGTASTQATIAVGAANASGAVAWVSGTSYAIGDARYSPLSFATYRRRTVGAGAIDPSLDAANWAAINPQSPGAALYLNSLYGTFN